MKPNAKKGMVIRMKKDVKYRIGKNSAGTVIGIVMLLIFGGITLWLYLSKNGAFFFGLLLSLVMLAVNAASLYNELFYKIIIDSEGLYYRTAPSDGKKYGYSDIAKVWVSFGKNLNGTESEYCNVRLCSGEDIKFLFFPYDAEGIGYLMKMVEKQRERETHKRYGDDTQIYHISGKFLGKTRIVISAVILLITVLLEIALIRNTVLALIIPIGIILAAVDFSYNLIRYFCFAVRIEPEGFFVRTNPFDGKYYNYSVIRDCKVVMKKHKHRDRGRVTHTMYYYYFVFWDRDGVDRKFQFEKAVSSHEIGVLKDRITRAKR